ncbi:BREX-1 system phosphatase PglZ type A [uncultured Dialister sp.]|uniref:BREX-1 system phosphatase PglZ type A n=1 Tax=uncultured Dialister sp. TaxID=278064 RepID=UPI00263203F4|nr:BREX-1 system phosphatase PglZ type A [uncultured Dialister sp.]
MAQTNNRDLTLEQVADKLNELFDLDTGERHIVFWYDADGTFKDDIDELAQHLTKAKVWKLTGRNQFRTKVLLEREDKENSYLLYADYPKPPLAENHLEDMELYSESFQADRISLLMQEMDVGEDCRSVLLEHEDFFAAASRRKAFLALPVETYTNDSILLAMTCVVAKVKSISLVDLLRSILMGDLNNSPALEAMGKWHLLPYFWGKLASRFGYQSENPNLTDFVVSLFATYASREVNGKSGNMFGEYIYPDKSGNIMAFLDDFMNNEKTAGRFDELSQMAFEKLSAMKSPEHLSVENWVNCHAFSYADDRIIEWIVSRLLAEDLSAKLADKDMETIARQRVGSHFGKQKEAIYNLALEARNILAVTQYAPGNNIEELMKNYVEKDYKIDRAYRKFYFFYDQLSSKDKLEQLRKLVENVYTNCYMGKLLVRWNECFVEKGNMIGLPQQQNFFRYNLDGEKEKTVVIISDALRYEAGRDIFERLADDPKAHREMEYMVSTLPSFTRLGMEALLPHKTLTMTGNGKNIEAMVDGVHAIGITTREQVLQSYVPKSVCLLYTDAVKMSRAELRSRITGKVLVYVYHDQIDVTGENKEDEIFNACEKAVGEIISFMRQMVSSGNIYKFIITSDHGFIYKRDGFKEWEKIGNVNDNNAMVKRRWIMADEPVIKDGVRYLPEKSLLGGENNKIISFPLGMTVFKASGGLSYIHGGSSPQEMIIPLIKVKFEKYRVDTSKVKLNLISSTRKVTNSYVVLDFIQSEAVSAEVKPAHVLTYFTDKNGTKLSNENIAVLEVRDDDIDARRQKLSYHLRNIHFDPNETYYLAFDDADTGEELAREPFHIEISTQGGGFDA